MPKINKQGGRNHKKMASKHARSGDREAIRLSKCDQEMYARIIKMNGDNADVICSDKVTRLLQIRKKFKGRNKRDNNISTDTLVLVGIRDWEVRSEKKKPVVDLLYVYSANQFENLKDIPAIYEILPNKDSYKDDSCGFVFSTKPTWMIKKEEEDAKKALEEKELLEKQKEEEEEMLAKEPVEANPHLNKESFAWDLDDGNEENNDDFNFDDI